VLGGGGGSAGGMVLALVLFASSDFILELWERWGVLVRY
jgi:hypothetical protein